MLRAGSISEASCVHFPVRPTRPGRVRSFFAPWESFAERRFPSADAVNRAADGLIGRERAVHGDVRVQRAMIRAVNAVVRMVLRVAARCDGPGRACRRSPCADAHARRFQPHGCVWRAPMGRSPPHARAKLTRQCEPRPRAGASRPRAGKVLAQVRQRFTPGCECLAHAARSGLVRFFRWNRGSAWSDPEARPISGNRGKALGIGHQALVSRDGTPDFRSQT